MPPHAPSPAALADDPVALAAELIRRPSVTPAEAGTLELLEAVLSPLGFRCARIERGGVSNLYARLGEGGPVFGFNGHVDVVPPGDAAAWTHPPFSGALADGMLWGRGAADMKSGVAAFVCAAAALAREGAPRGSIALLVTGDEEGEAEHGTRAILDWMAENGERLDHCLVGEPTCPERLGEMMKIGRRGSMTAWITAHGRQGHAAYPHRALNPLPALARLVDRLASRRLDEGTEHFEPSTLAVTTIDVGNPATNVIPAEGRATVNIRFNDAHDSASLEAWLRDEAERVARETGVRFDLRVKVSGESFLTPPGPFCQLIADAVEAETGLRPVASTSGGTSDARFVKDMCPVVEFGLAGATMHQTDERVPAEDVRKLARIYARIMRDYFARGGV
ncbi:succinyl-diaminopimelate desuccinylase [Oceanicella actignis]|uniref:Succinyl-diaminopimelate desuccinylase n=1 Tax=Oceanicella actignis TaxID=1189325 RepID=A0A1M7SG87_9RHOB|nr:succinyl-diaminopimelate desuccinylase [Oceanicella actignis]SET21492.1 succinyldiaminopimelate desuccinylase [Oceanicella actignis]SHN57477.1 succinyldiaminopimelate desuccinylase [Oceanicella actignis]